jgi:hypothetical protein
MGNIDLSRLVFPAATSGRFQKTDWTQAPQGSDIMGLGLLSWEASEIAHPSHLKKEV